MHLFSCKVIILAFAGHIYIADIQKVETTQPMVAEIFSDCRRIKAGLLWICGTYQLEFYKWPSFAWWLQKYFTWCFRNGWIRLISCECYYYIGVDHSVFSKTLNIASHALLQNFQKIQILATGGFKLSELWCSKNHSHWMSSVVMKTAYGLYEANKKKE